MKNIALHWQILGAMFLAAGLGLIASPDTTIFSVNLNSVLDFVGTLFLSALKMVVIPLIIASIISSIGTIKSNKTLQRLGLKTFSLYICTSLLAILIGLFWVNLISPGLVDGQPAGAQLNLSVPENAAATLSQVANKNSADIFDVFLRLVPTNVFSAAAQGDLLALIFFSLLFAVFMRYIDERPKAVLIDLWQGIYSTMLAMTMWVISFAPIGVFALVAKTVIATGFSALAPVLVFFACVCLALLTHLAITLPILLIALGRIHPIRHYRALLPALLTAFSTASSSATLPLTIKCLADTGVSERTNSFVLPLGATINMDGTALYECVAAIFIAQAYGLDLSLATQFSIVLIALLTSIGVAGIPAASLVAITIILAAIGLPVEAIGLLLVTDRLLDMLRTGVNVLGDSCCAAIIASSEKEKLHTHF